MFGSRGQEEGPFALMLAAIMLALLIPIVAGLFGQFQQWECENRIINNLETLARELELSATLGGGNRRVPVDLGAYECGGTTITRFSISEHDEGECLDACQTPHCRMITALFEPTAVPGEAPPVPEAVVPPVCVRIPLNVRLMTAGCGAEDPSWHGLDMENIKPGVHTLILTKKDYDVLICEEN